MSIRARVLFAAIASSALLTACSSDDQSPTAPQSAAAFAKSGTAPSGGGSGGGSTGGSSTGGATVGPPVAPSYTARITKIGKVPAGFYYGTPSEWEVGGYAFKSVFVSNFKPVNGPIVVGACVSVTFYDADPDRILTELKTQVSSKCD